MVIFKESALRRILFIGCILRLYVCVYIPRGPACTFLSDGDCDGDGDGDGDENNNSDNDNNGNNYDNNNKQTK